MMMIINIVTLIMINNNIINNHVFIGAFQDTQGHLKMQNVKL